MNGGVYSTGNEIVDENAKLNISGNIIPQVWYRTIIRESGKPNLTAIIILADIVYWYKPTEIRDEGTGQVIGVRKKFKSDLLQRSYQQISEQFGISKKEATNAVVFLEKLGVVKRVFRTISMNGIVVNNVLYLELIVDRLKELTYPEETGADPVSFEKRREKSKAEKISSHTAIEEEIHFVEERAVPFQRERVSPFKEGAYPDRETEPWIPKEVPQTDSGQTNTEITTKTTAESTQKNTTEIGNGYRDNPILSYQAAEEQFKDQIDYFRYEGVHYHVSLENVFVFMQGHVVIHTLLEAVPGYCLLVDIGGGTTDLVEFVDGMPDGKYSISDKAALYCIGKVNEEAIAKTGAGVPAYITEAFMRTGSYDCPKQYQDVIKNCLKSYAEEIYGIIQANHYNLDLTKMVFMGGGSSIVEHFGANEGKDVQFVTDIHANARGCEEAVKSIIRAKQRKMRTA